MEDDIAEIDQQLSEMDNLGEIIFVKPRGSFGNSSKASMGDAGILLDGFEEDNPFPDSYRSPDPGSHPD
jgi:hypothetical protein